MTIGKQLGQAIVSMLLLIVLMLPTAVQFSHVFEGHEHILCNKKSSHIHQDVPDCQICDFHLASFNYDVVDYPDLLLPNIPTKVEKSFSTLLFHSFKITNTQLRAPPYFLV